VDLFLAFKFLHITAMFFAVAAALFGENGGPGRGEKG
jgi:hypothetical protein